MKKIVSIIMALAMVLGMGAMAFAATGDGVVSITNGKEGETYPIYKILDLNYVKTPAVDAVLYTQADVDAWEADPVNAGGTCPFAVGGIKTPAVPAQESFGYSINPNFQNFFDGVITESVDDDNDPATPNVDKTLAQLGKHATDVQAYNWINGHTTDAQRREMATAFGKYALENTIAPTKTGSGTADITGVPFGYYVMVPSTKDVDSQTGNAPAAGSAIFALNTVTPEAAIANKSTYPTIEKKVKDTIGETAWSDNNVAAVGDTMDFQIETAVPDYVGYSTYQFIVTDTMSHLIYKANTLKIKVGSGDEVALPESCVNGNVITVDFSNADVAAAAFGTGKTSIKDGTIGDAIVITYQATLAEDAVVGSTGNENKVNLQFSTDPSDLSKKDTTPDAKTHTYNFQVVVNKKGQTDDGALIDLTGTTWQLEVKRQGDADFRTVGSPYTVTAADPQFTWAGLDAGQYKLTELTAPEGYKVLDAPIEFTIAATADETSLATLAATVTRDEQNSVVQKVETIATGTVALDIVNHTFGKLPATGGMGLMMLGAAAGIAAIGAFMTRRKNEEDAE